MDSTIIAENQCPRASAVFLLSLSLLLASPIQADNADKQQAKLPTTPKQITYEVVDTYPHRSDAYTQGLEVLSADTLLESIGRYGKSELRVTDLDDGTVIASHKLPDKLFGEGVTMWQGLIYQLTWHAGELLVYKADTLRYQKTLKYRGQGWGLTHNQQHLIMSNGSPQLSFRTAEDFQEVRRLTVTRASKPLSNLNELEWIDGFIFANIYPKSYIVVINPDSGEVVAEIDIASLHTREGVPNGIAWDAKRERVLVTGKLWSKIFALRLHNFPDFSKPKQGVVTFIREYVCQLLPTFCPTPSNTPPELP